MARKKREPGFEEALGELEELVALLEQGELPLEEALRRYERGVALTRICQSALDQARQRVDILTAPSTDAPLAPFDATAGDGNDRDA